MKFHGLSQPQQWGGREEETLCNRLSTSWMHPSKRFPMVTLWIISSNVFIYESSVLSVTHTCSVQSIPLGAVGGLVLPASSCGWDRLDELCTGIWAPANQWLSFAVDRIHHNRGTFSKWSLSTCISVTETLVKVANQRGQILWLLMPWALSLSQRNKKNKQTKTAFVKWAKEYLYH